MLTSDHVHVRALSSKVPDPAQNPRDLVKHAVQVDELSAGLAAARAAGDGGTALEAAHARVRAAQAAVDRKVRDDTPKVLL